MKRKVQRLPLYSLPPYVHSLPHYKYNIPHQSGTFVKIDEPTTMSSSPEVHSLPSSPLLVLYILWVWTNV